VFVAGAVMSLASLFLCAALPKPVK
jgi:hypothetical protein